MCFVNAVWQMLLLVPPLVHVLRAVKVAGCCNVVIVDDSYCDDGKCENRKNSNRASAADRHFSLGQPFPSSLPVCPPITCIISFVRDALFGGRFSVACVSSLRHWMKPYLPRPFLLLAPSIRTSSSSNCSRSLYLIHPKACPPISLPPSPQR